MKAREGSRRFSDPKKTSGAGEVLRKFGRGVVCEKLCRRLQEFDKKSPSVQRVKTLVGIYMQSSAFSLLLKSANLLKFDFVKLLAHALKGFIIDLFKAKNDL